MADSNQSSLELVADADVWVQPDSTDANVSPEALQEETRLRKRHWAMLRICAVVVILAFLLQTRPDHRVQFRWGPSIPLPESCGTKILFGFECPGCGLTRSFIALSHGDFWASWKWNRVGWVLLAALLAQFPYRLWLLKELDQHRILRSPWPQRFAWLLIVLLIGNWVCKVCGV